LKIVKILATIKIRLFKKKKIKILKTLELIPTRVECYNTISRPNDGIQKLKNLKFFLPNQKFQSTFFLNFHISPAVIGS
jgi:hypothetical protein